MSWSIKFIGKVSRVAEAVENASEGWDPTSKAEYDSMKQNLSSLVKSNFDKEQGHDEPFIEIEANGHGFVREGIPVFATFSCSIKPLFGKVV